MRFINFFITISFLLLLQPTILISSPNSYKNSNNFKFENIDIGFFDYMSKSLLMLFKFYQSNITDIGDQTCPMQPSCSNFAIQAVEKYGFIIGPIKTFDRLHRCSHDLKYYEIITVDGRNFYKDLP